MIISARGEVSPPHCAKAFIDDRSPDLARHKSPLTMIIRARGEVSSPRGGARKNFKGDRKTKERQAESHRGHAAMATATGRVRVASLPPYAACLELPFATVQLRILGAFFNLRLLLK